eukprot:12273-Heterococcus_DN1.PRE.4
MQHTTDGSSALKVLMYYETATRQEQNDGSSSTVTTSSSSSSGKKFSSKSVVYIHMCIRSVVWCNSAATPLQSPLMTGSLSPHANLLSRLLYWQLAAVHASHPCRQQLFSTHNEHEATRLLATKPA